MNNNKGSLFIFSLWTIATFIVTIFILAGCSTGPSAAVLERQKAEMVRKQQQSEQARAEHKFQEALISRAALKRYLSTNPDAKYVEKAKAALDIEMTAVTVNEKSTKVSTDANGLSVQSSSQSTVFTVGKSTKTEAAAVFGCEVSKKYESVEKFKGCSYFGEYKRGEKSFGMADMSGGGPPMGTVVFYFDAKDILRKISEVD